MMRVQCPCHITGVTFHMSLTLRAKAKNFPPSNSPTLQSSQYPKDQEKEKNLNTKDHPNFSTIQPFYFIHTGRRGQRQGYGMVK